MTQPSGPKIDYESLAAFRYALRQFLQFSSDAAKEVRLSPQQHQALLAIRGASDPDKVTVGYLAERMQLKPHSAVGLIDRLSAKKLVRRRPDALDKRIVHLALTAQGNQLIALLSAAHQEELRRLGPELRDQLESILRKPKA
jgi:DNA-binding MarR family transcriptional regulator